MQRLIFGFILLTIFTSFQPITTLKGTWEYRGGKFNNKIAPAPKGYAQQRKYTDNKFEAYLLEKGEKPKKYEAGNYELKGDTCLEKQTFCLQAQNLIGVTVHYQYTLQHDTLVLKAKLPNGAVEEDYWKRVK